MKDLPMAEQEGQMVIRLPADLDQNDWLGFRDRIQRTCLDRGLIQVVIDCEGCDELPSIAFGCFTSLARDLRRVQGTLHLVHVSERIRKVMTRTRMDNLVPIRGTLTEIIRRSSPPPDRA